MNQKVNSPTLRSVQGISSGGEQTVRKPVIQRSVNSADFEDVLVSVSFLLRKSPGAEFWTTYQERRLVLHAHRKQVHFKRIRLNQKLYYISFSADWSIEALLHKWKLQCVSIPLPSFDANQAQLAGSTLPGRHTVQMLIISMAA